MDTGMLLRTTMLLHPPTNPFHPFAPLRKMEVVATVIASVVFPSSGSVHRIVKTPETIDSQLALQQT